MSEACIYSDDFGTGAVLAGGRSRRMGQPKEGLRLPDGRPMIEHVLAPLRAVCRQVVVVGDSRGWPVPVSDRQLHILDRAPDLGPLGGLASLFASGLDVGYLVAACDQPLLTAELLLRLQPGDPARPHLFREPAADSFHPFPAWYPAALAPHIQELLAAGNRSLRALIARADPVWIPLAAEDEPLLAGINTPEQERALARLFDKTHVSD